MSSSFLAFDLFPKTFDDFRKKTASGGTVSIIALSFLALIFFSEFVSFLRTDVVESYVVDNKSQHEKMKINFDIVFQKVPCSCRSRHNHSHDADISIDAMDVTGVTLFDCDHFVYKRRLDRYGREIGIEAREEGNENTLVKLLNVELHTANDQKHADLPAGYCGSCYGSEEVAGTCCNTCLDVRESYRKKGWAFREADKIEQCDREGYSLELERQKNEGCRMHGHVEVAKVGGNVHFAPGKSFASGNMHVHDLSMFGGQAFNFTHKINKLSFGTEFPGMKNPLDNELVPSPLGNMMHQYFLKVVSSEYIKSNGQVILSNMYSVTDTSKEVNAAAGKHGLPGVFFVFEIEPLRVVYEEVSKSFVEFLTMLGGVFTVMSLIDSAVLFGINSMKAKQELGKQI